MKKFISLVLGLLLACMVGVALAEADAADVVLDAEARADEIVVAPGDELSFDIVLTPAETDEAMRIGIKAEDVPVEFVSAVGGDVNDTVPPQALTGYFVTFNADGLTMNPEGTELTGDKYTVTTLEAGKIGTLTFKVSSTAGEGTYTVGTFVDFGEGTVEGSITFTVEGSARIPGDGNGDGVVNMKDLIMLVRFLAKWPDVTIIEANADVDESATVNMKDLILLVRWLAKWENVVLK